MEAYQTAIERIDPRYLRFAAAYSRYARAMFRMLEGNPGLLEQHQRETEAATKEIWLRCKQAGIRPDGARP